MEHLIEINSKDGRDALYSAIAELKEFGYMVRRKVQGSSGKIKWETEVHEMPPNPEADPTAERFPTKTTSGKSRNGKKSSKSGNSTASGKSRNGSTISGQTISGKSGRILSNDQPSNDQPSNDQPSNDQDLSFATGAANLEEAGRGLEELEFELDDLENPILVGESVAGKNASPELIEKTETLEGVTIPPAAKLSKKQEKAIKRQWLEDEFGPNYPYRLTKGGNRVRRLGSVTAKADYYLEKIPIEAILSGKATSSLRNMTQAGRREFIAEHRTEPPRVKLKDGHEVLALPYVSDPELFFTKRLWEAEYDLGEPVAAVMPWSDTPPEEFELFAEYVGREYLARLKMNEGRRITRHYAKSWLEGCRYAPARYEASSGLWAEFAELRAEQIATQQAIANAPTLQEMTPLAAPQAQPDALSKEAILARLRVQYQIPNSRGQAIKRAIAAGFTEDDLQPKEPIAV
jgi:hypothetical protein